MHVAIDAMIAHGPHISTLTEDMIEIFGEDMEYHVVAKFIRLIPWETLRKNSPQNLKISPVAVVHQHDRHGQIILDLSSPMGVGHCILHQAINATMQLMVPLEAMEQIGFVMPQVLHF